MTERDDNQDEQPLPQWYKPERERDERELLIALLSGPAITEEPDEDE